MPRKLLIVSAAVLLACSSPERDGPGGEAPSAVAAPGASAAPGEDPAGGAPARAVGIERAFPALTFAQGTDLQAVPDGTGRLFVTEQEGLIRVFANEPGVKAAGTFLDIRAKVAAGGEMGLLGLAFHPRYRENRWFYVNYTADGPRRTIVSRFTASAEDAGRADPASEHVILTFEQPYSNHNGGQLAFGPDGYLYVATGDGGGAGDPFGNGQSKSTLLGKLLRIDVDRPSGGRPYGIPADNPLAGNRDGHREELFCWGLRNPWRFSFDAETGRIWAADVGQYRLEEVDLIEKGKNYGWNVMEGSECFKTPGCDQRWYEKPVAEYGRELGGSITGGYVYRGRRVPALTGQYVHADYISGRIWAMAEGGKPRQLLKADINPSTFGLDAERELYVIDHGGGGLWRLTAR